MMVHGRWRCGVGSMEDNIMHCRQRGATIHRLKVPVWLEEEGSREGGGQSTDEYGGRKRQGAAERKRSSMLSRAPEPS